MSTNSQVLLNLVAAAVWWFFFQSFRVIFSVLFGIIYDRVFVGPIDAWLVISIVLLLLALLLPALAPTKPTSQELAVAAAVVVITRIGLSINNPEVRYWSSLVVIAGSGLFLAGLLKRARRAVLLGFLLALALDVAFRAVGQTYDAALRVGWLPYQILVTVLLLILIAWSARNAEFQNRERRPPNVGILWGLSFGGLLFLELSLLSLPNAIARWSQWSYVAIAPTLLMITLLPLSSRVRRTILDLTQPRSWLRIFFAGLLIGTLLYGYFANGIFAAFSLLLSQTLLLIGLVGMLSSEDRLEANPGPWIALGSLFFLVLNFLNAFAFTYPYTLPFLRGLGWVFYVIAGLPVAAGVLRHAGPFDLMADAGSGYIWALPFAATTLVLVGISIWPQPVAKLPEDGNLRLATYNIHYGYDEHWRYTLENIASTIEDNDVDVIALQEVDTGRLTSYAVDDAYYLARRLKMGALYLPTVEHLTGIAILYKGTPEVRTTKLLTSLQEQTGIAHILLNSGSSSLHSFGIWVGLSDEDTVRQLNEALDFIGASSPATFGGDFNSTPETPVIQAVEKAGFTDPFIELGINPPPLTDPATSPTKRIDYVWIRGVKPLKAWVSPSLASDHRMVVVELDTSR
jgi:endonuclease/exonuclease/phosphatase family metal-dependent hydrolase/MFS family permease